MQDDKPKTIEDRVVDLEATLIAYEMAFSIMASSVSEEVKQAWEHAAGAAPVIGLAQPLTDSQLQLIGQKLRELVAFARRPSP